MKDALGFDGPFPYLSRLVADLESVGSRDLEKRIASLQRTGMKILPLKGGATRPLPEHIRKAVLQALDEGDVRPSRGLSELREAITDLLQQEIGVSIDPERHVMITNGAMQALNITFRALLNPGDRVVIPSPAFFFGGMIRLAGGEPVYVPCSENEEWRWDLARISQAIDARTKLVLACNPTNPTGYLPTPEDLQRLLDLAKKHNFLVVADESYKRFVYDGAAFSSAGALLATHENVILISSMSKDYAIPNWRVGYIVASASLISTFVKLLEWECLHCGYVGQKVAAAAIQGPQDWLVDLPSAYQRNRDIAYEAVQQTQILSCVKPKAGPFLFVNVFGCERDCGKVAEELLVDAGIATVPGSYFQAPGYLRVPFGGTTDTLHALANSLRQWAMRRQVPAQRNGK